MSEAGHCLAGGRSMHATYLVSSVPGILVPGTSMAPTTLINVPVSIPLKLYLVPGTRCLVHEVPGYGLGGGKFAFNLLPFVELFVPQSRHSLSPRVLIFFYRLYNEVMASNAALLPRRIVKVRFPSPNCGLRQRGPRYRLQPTADDDVKWPRQLFLFTLTHALGGND